MMGETSEGRSTSMSAWLAEPGTSPEAIFDCYRFEIEKANAVITAMPLETPPRACRIPLGSDDFPIYAQSCSTSSPKPRAMPEISTRLASCSMAKRGSSLSNTRGPNEKYCCAR